MRSWRRAWQPTPVFLPGESLGQRRLVGYSPRGHKGSDTTEQLTHIHTHTQPQESIRQLPTEGRSTKYLTNTSRLSGSPKTFCLSKCHRPVPSTKTWWLNIIWYVRWNPVMIKGHEIKTKEVLIRKGLDKNASILINGNKYTILMLFCIWLPWWLSNRESVCQCRRHGLDSWVRRIPGRRKWQPAPVFWPRNPHGQRSLAGYSLWGCKVLFSD